MRDSLTGQYEQSMFSISIQEFIHFLKFIELSFTGITEFYKRKKDMSPGL